MGLGLSGLLIGWWDRVGWLVGLADLNTEKANVQERIATYFATLLSVGTFSHGSVSNVY